MSLGIHKLVRHLGPRDVAGKARAHQRRWLGVVLQAGNIVLDTIGRDVWIGSAVLPLARQELAILEHLMRRLGRVVPKAVLEEKLYGIDEGLGSNAIPVHVHHLRRKLAEAGAGAEVHTVRGIGYPADRTARMTVWLRSIQGQVAPRLAVVFVVATALGVGTLLYEGMQQTALQDACDVDALAHALRREFVLDLAWAIPLFAAAALDVGVWAVRSALRPLRPAFERAAAIAPDAAGVRLPVDALQCSP